MNWSLRKVEQKLRLSRRIVTGLMAEGFVCPTRGPRNAFQFSFRDLVLLRTAHGLRSAQVPPRTILRALGKLRAELPSLLPLTGLRITADGRNVVVWDDQGPRDVVSDQLVLDFQLVPDEEDGLVVLETTVPRVQPVGMEGPSEAELAFRRGELLEDVDRAAAADAYRDALARDPTHTHAAINLGAMLCEEKNCEEARQVFEGAQRNGVQHPLLQFNFGVVLEDLDMPEQALRAYDEALRLDPVFADAHFNAGMLRRRLGDERGALRHLNAYRRLFREAENAPP
ncbi:tetratricopeptide repeat protein [Pseudorhodoferax soli]|uniref:Tetratricopeptide repeat protein n=1 Tax=Pseudorhodoferax soli TaxID=545864 RepID=A0A368XU23_9BURK|nr:tetratricopeptide repeat protein [Pseudorhodoferax soli]RCW69524.1 tetratricopeptide repeat protein [Pseudorhodoferax soli]